jgi:serine/threonine protein kinase
MWWQAIVRPVSTNEPMQNLIGTQIAGRFTIIDLLGEGGAGQVYLAEHAVLDRKFAIKVLQENVRDDQRFVKRFRREARTASLLEHPNIVRITDFGRTPEGQLYLVMEHVSGESLEQLLETVRPAPLPMERAIPILAQVCSAVQAAHAEGIVHRDLKPDNVVLGRTLSGDEQVKILDFGLAKIMAGAQGDSAMRITGKGEIFGTPEYMAPEQARGEPVDMRADIYSLAAMAYDLLAGRPPIEHDSLGEQLRAIQQELPVPLSRVRPDTEPLVPVEIEVLVHRCLLKDPNQRPSTVDGLVKVFERHRAHLPQRRAASLPGIEVETILGDTDPDSAGSTPDPTPVAAMELDTFQDEPNTLIPGGVAGSGDVESKSWHWSQAVKRAEVLVARLTFSEVAPQTLVTIQAQQRKGAEQMVTVETELAVERANLDEPDTSELEVETRLRGAIMDLSMERDQLEDTGPADLHALEDLDYQIRVLETNLGEVYRQTTQRQANQEETVREMETYAGLCEKQLRATEAQLIKEVFTARPAPCPQDLAQLYADLANTLRAFDTAES